MTKIESIAISATEESVSETLKKVSVLSTVDKNAIRRDLNTLHALKDSHGWRTDPNSFSEVKSAESNVKEAIGKSKLLNGPRIGHVTFGAFCPPNAIGLPKWGINPTKPIGSYEHIMPTYNTHIKEKFGVQLAMASYFKIGSSDYQQRIFNLRNWIKNAHTYGVPTIALELPRGHNKNERDSNYGSINSRNPECVALQKMFTELKSKGISVKVRFLSEANLYDNPYSATRDENVKIIFSPLINTATENESYEKSSAFKKMLRMYDPSVYSYIGGTIYARPGGDMTETYRRYYDALKNINPKGIFVIDELGGPNECHNQIQKLAKNAIRGDFKELRHVNLFVYNNYEKKGVLSKGNLIDPNTGKSYLHKVFAVDNKSRLVASRNNNSNRTI